NLSAAHSFLPLTPPTTSTLPPPPATHTLSLHDALPICRIDIEPKLSVWQAYARAHRLHPAVTAYLELRPQHFYKIENDVDGPQLDRKSTRLNSSHVSSSYAVFCLQKKILQIIYG